MRTLIYSLNLTLDGCCDHTKMTGHDEILEFYTHLLQDADLLVYGRKTYQLMVPYWPDVAKAGSESKAALNFAKAFDAMDKVVFSKTLDSAPGNTRVVRTSPRDEILQLKQTPGRNMLLGGVEFPAHLVGLGLVDEFHFVIHPTLAGEGRRLLEGISLQQQLKLKLVESKSLKSGCVALRYSKE